MTDRKSYRATIVAGGEGEFEVPPHKSILDAASDAGIQLPYACRVGGCTACTAKLIEGEVDHPKASALTRYQRERGYVLLCVTGAASDIKIAVGPGAQRGMFDRREDS